MPTPNQNLKVRVKRAAVLALFSAVALMGSPAGKFSHAENQRAAAAGQTNPASPQRIPAKPEKHASLEPENKQPAVQKNAKAAPNPAPQTPSSPQLARALNAKNLWLGLPVYIRVFKKESELEVWLKRPASDGDGRFVLLKTYKICRWSGQLGPKIYEGDKQAPEGFYTVTSWQLGQYSAKWPQSLNFGFPNTFDAAKGRTGSHLLVHGGCHSIGCYAMTNERMDEIHEIVTAAFRSGQKRMHLRAYPFRMTKRKLAAYGKNQWHSFWRQLKPAYDAFEATRRPPKVSVCGESYVLSSQLDGLAPDKRAKRKCRPARSLARPGLVASIPGPRSGVPRKRWGPTIVVKCNQKLPSCRRWLSLQKKKAAKKSKYPPRIVSRCITCRR